MGLMCHGQPLGVASWLGRLLGSINYTLFLRLSKSTDDCLVHWINLHTFIEGHCFISQARTLSFSRLCLCLILLPCPCSYPCSACTWSTVTCKLLSKALIATRDELSNQQWLLDRPVDMLSIFPIPKYLADLLDLWDPPMPPSLDFCWIHFSTSV